MKVKKNILQKVIRKLFILQLSIFILLAACSEVTEVESNNDGVLVDSVYYDTIQEAIDNAADEDTLFLTKGVYAGTGNKNLTWDGLEKHIVITSFNFPELADETIIDCGGKGSAFDFDGSHQNISDVIQGITIQNTGNSTWDSGIYCEDVSITITHVYFLGCDWTAVYMDDSNTIIENCNFYDNLVAVMADYDSSPNIRTCVFEDNYESIFARETASPYIINSLIAYNERGIHCLENSSAHLVNNTITNNDNFGVKIYNAEGSSLKNSIIWNNEYGLDTGTDSIYVTHSCLQNSNEWTLVDSLDNIFEDPMFVGEGFYNLRHGSPCIDEGDNSFLENIEYDLDGNPRISNYVVDMGAFEFQQGLK